jgi:hypothetical protein
VKGIKIIRGDDKEDGVEPAAIYYEAQDAYYNYNIDHIPIEKSEKLYGYRLT